MTPLILGSQSPRRREILKYFSLPFKQVSSGFAEESVPFNGDPAQHALTLALKKSEVLADQFPTSVILTADTVVYFKGKHYDKPRDEEEAFSMLSDLSGEWHSVFTAVVVRRGDEIYSDVEETKVLFHELTPEQIRLYLNKIPYLDKAAAYAIQRSAALIVRKVEGCFYNVMGLPIYTLQKLLRRVDIDLWQHLDQV